jgi:hypothetical protein
MRSVRLWLVCALILAVVAGGAWTWWRLDLRWRPHTIGSHQAEIARILDTAGWVSPHLPGPRLYMLTYRACPACVWFERTELPKLRAAGVDTRIIVVALPDQNGLAYSTPAERATVAELWVNRDWKLFERWQAVILPVAWTAPGLPAADGDAARTAVVEAGRKAVRDLTPLLAHSGVKFAWPTLIWWNKAGQMRGCACLGPRSWRNVERELGA